MRERAEILSAMVAAFQLGGRAAMRMVHDACSRKGGAELWHDALRMSPRRPISDEYSYTWRGFPLPPARLTPTLLASAHSAILHGSAKVIL